MIREIRRVLGLETVNEKLSTLTDIDSRLADISVEIGELAQEYTRRSESRNNVIKSIDSQEILNEVSKRFDLFEKSHLENLLPLKKEKDSLEYEKQSLLKSNEVSELYEFNKKYNRFKAKYKSGEISKETFGTFLKAKHNGKTLYSDILVFNKEGKLLLLQRAAIDDSNPQKWGLPGGHVDPNESHQYAATRELVEETGLYLPELDFVWSFNDKDVHIEYFRADNVCEKEFPIVLQSDEHTDYKWIDIKDIDKYEMSFNMAENIKKALGIKDEIVKSINPDVVKEKIRKVMEEFKNGTLKTPDGKVVADQKQAIAIAISESKKVNKSEQDDLSTFLEPFLKAYKDGIISETALSNVIKARTGKYADTAENRRLKRVGQEYGSKKQDEGNIKDEGKKPENDNTDKPKTNDLAADARNASVAQLEAAIKESPNEEVRQAAHNELARREKEEKPQSEENKKFGEDYGKNNSTTTDKEDNNNKSNNKEDKQVQAKDNSVKESESTSDNKEVKSDEKNKIYEGIANDIETMFSENGFLTSVSKSKTDFGDSWYIKTNIGNNLYQIRISDHSVGANRLKNDPTLEYIDYQNKDYKNQINNAIKSLNKIKEKLEDRNKLFDEEKKVLESYQKRRNDMIEILSKDLYKINEWDKTSKTLDEVKKQNPKWEHILQTDLGNGFFKYNYLLKDDSDYSKKWGVKNFGISIPYAEYLEENYKTENNNVQKSEQDNLTHEFSCKTDIEKTLNGGKADNLTIEDIAKKHNVSVDKIKKQLQMGIMVEMEHTNDPKQSIEIAMDHLTESSEYYTKLAKMESTFDKQKTGNKDE